MLERTASTLVSATEGLAWELNNHIDLPPTDTKMYFNVIVTNARLQLCEFSPDDVSIHDGKIPEDSKMTEVPVVRFHKQFAVRPAPGLTYKVEDAKDISSEKENTVLVVNAEKFSDFLHDFEVDGSSLNNYVDATTQAWVNNQ